MIPTVRFDQITPADATACHVWGASGWGWHLLEVPAEEHRQRREDLR